jgi:hypothetical protein
MDEPQEVEERLPAGYSMGMEDSNLLVLRRADGSVVKRFVFSSTSPTPQALRQAAEEDLLLTQPPRIFGNTPQRSKARRRSR